MNDAQYPSILSSYEKQLNKASKTAESRNQISNLINSLTLFSSYKLIFLCNHHPKKSTDHHHQSLKKIRRFIWKPVWHILNSSQYSNRVLTFILLPLGEQLARVNLIPFFRCHLEIGSKVADQITSQVQEAISFIPKFCEIGTHNALIYTFNSIIIVHFHLHIIFNASISNLTF